jgi:hypothetical protein
MEVAAKSSLEMLLARDPAECCSPNALHQRWRNNANDPGRFGIRGGGLIIAAVPGSGRRLKTMGALDQPEPGNRQPLAGNPKTRSVLRIGSLGARLAFPAMPVMSIVSLAAVHSVRMLLVRQSASEESL